MLPQVFRDILDSLLCFPTSLLFGRRIRIPRTDTAATVLLGALGVTSVFVTSSGSSASLLRLRLPATRTAPSGTRSTWFPRVRRWVVLVASASEGPFLITEAKNKDRENFGEERLLSVIDKYKLKLSDVELLDKIIDETSNFRSGIQEDDIALLIVRIE